MADQTILRVAGEQLTMEDQAQRDMRARLDAMGPVNMMALEEYKETAQRHEFLETQRQDLLQSIENTQNTIKEIDGSSMLDNTIIVMSSDVAQYHEFVNVPMVLFGGSKLGLKGGRVLKYPAGSRTPSDVWTGVAGALGVPMTAFGDPLYNQGPLPELFTTA